MTVTLGRAVLKRHALSIVSTVVLLGLSACLLGVPVPVALALWVVAAFLSFEIGRSLEPMALRRLGCRSPNRVECERLEPALATVARVELQVLDVAEPWIGFGLRTLVVTRALLDVLDDRALVGVLSQAVQPACATSLPGELIVWLGNLPLLIAWWFGRWLVQLGRLLAVAVGAGLVLPLLLWPVGFTRWVGLLFGAVGVGLSGVALVASGLAGPGLGLLVCWAVVPGLRALLDRERRQAQTSADDALVEAGLGWQLLEALETLAWADPAPAPRGLLGVMSRATIPVGDRADRIWRALARS